MRVPLKYKDYRHKFALLIEIYNPILRLKKREKEVLLDYLTEYKRLFLEGRDQQQIKGILFSTETRQRFRNDIKMSEPSYNNHIHQLKRKGILVEGQLMPMLASVIVNDDFSLEYSIIDHG